MKSSAVPTGSFSSTNCTVPLALENTSHTSQVCAPARAAGARDRQRARPSALLDTCRMTNLLLELGERLRRTCSIDTGTVWGTGGQRPLRRIATERKRVAAARKDAGQALGERVVSPRVEGRSRRLYTIAPLRDGDPLSV